MYVRLTNFLTYPRVRLLERGRDTVRVKIDGLVCDRICAARSQAALAALPGVRSAHVDFASGVADIEGAAPDEAACQRAIDSVVVGKPLRRALDAARRAASPPLHTGTARR
jgi:copper chaperone CopZ